MTTHVTTKKTVLFLFGGESSEHDVSLQSARNIQAACNLERIEPIFCYIDRSGQWWHADNATPPPPAARKNVIMPMLGTSMVCIGERRVHIDVIFPVLHGKNGEDGTVQGLATLLHTPIVGCGMESSVLCMDKILAKQLVENIDVPTVPYAVHRAKDPLPHFKDTAQQLGTPLFVKPARQGSSVGVSKATEDANFGNALQEALRYDDIVLIESAVEGARELEVAVLGSNADPQVSAVGEIIPDREFYSYEAKYAADATSSIVIPARIDSATTERAQALACHIFTQLGCRGLARVDFFLDQNGKFFFNEINTMPGFTDISMYPKLWENSGVSYAQLVQTLLDQAM